MVTLSFTVHRASDTTMAKLVKVDGDEISANVPCFEVELVSTQSGSGSYTHRFTGAQIDEARKTFVAGETVSFTVE